MANSTNPQFVCISKFNFRFLREMKKKDTAIPVGSAYW